MRRYIKLAAATLLMAATEAPKLPAGQATPVAVPYDVNADAHAQVAAAFARAKANGHKVMLDFGGNWCPDCRMLAGVLDMPQVKQWTDASYETVMIDVGRENKNMDLAAQYGIKIHAVPTVLMLTADGKLLNKDDVFALANARGLSAQAVVNILAAGGK
jgi:thiol-disulfide isomerase/thioredoxin